ncbi:unnamed protein product [marine sediment metagenome]|uniref:Basal-body rod modification protein FlgD n=1 Tax=marine sediment metagenome TaxID=412755 RepID=X1JXK5_9ZZZZ
MAVSSIASASNMQMDYMKLLITQLQNQNPLEPLNNNEMASQLAQFSSLQQLETMNASFAEVLAVAERDLTLANRGYANSLLGKKVTFYSTEESTGEPEKMVGVVDSVFNAPETNMSLLGVKDITDSDGNPVIDSDGDPVEYTLGLDAVVLVEN